MSNTVIVKNVTIDNTFLSYIQLTFVTSYLELAVKAGVPLKLPNFQRYRPRTLRWDPNLKNFSSPILY